MALQVWLPLNGDLRNLGLDKDYDTPSINYAVWVSEGKIGNKSLYPTTTTSGVLSYSKTLSNSHSYSICAWVKTIEDVTGSRYIIWTGSDSNYVGFGFRRSYSGNSIDGMVFGTSITLNTSLNQWHHIAMIIDYENLQFSAYLDGVFVQSKTYTQRTVANHGVNIGWLRPSYYPYKGYINDVRIYDHCLSPKEVKEISKGLVLHYKLDDMMRSNENLLPTSSQRMSETGQTSTNEYMNLCSCINIWDNYGLVPYTISFEIKAAVAHSFNIYGDYGSKPKYGFSRKSINVTTEWQRFSHTFTPYLNDNSGTWAGISVYGIYGSGAIVSVRKVKLELGTIETPLFIDDKIVYDSSGYENNGIILGNLIINNNTPRYNISTKFDGNSYIYLVSPPTIEVKTISLWVKWDTMDFSGNYASQSVVFVDNGSKIGLGLYSGGILLVTSGAGGNGYAYPKTNLTANTWYHFVIISTGTTTRDLYINGIKQTKNSNTSNWSYSINQLQLGRRSTTTDGFKGQISDFRMYITALSDNDVVELYNTSAIIDNLGNIYGYQFEENGEINMLSSQNLGIINKQWVSGLSKFTQTNCQCTLTDDGYRIYRPANLTQANDGNTMWGGLVIDNTENRFGLQDNHTYIIEFDVKGQSSGSAADIYWSNNVGWSGGGLTPNPTDVVIGNPVKSNFNSTEWQHFFYKFTISDGLYKTCTSAYSGFVAGNTYISYKGFKFGYNYASTGTLGTDIYIKNLTMHDITNDVDDNINITKAGIVNVSNFLEENSQVQFFHSGTVNSNQLIEI